MSVNLTYKWGGLMGFAKILMKDLVTGWDRFWFSPVSLLNLALFRIIIGLTMFFLYLNRLTGWRLFFSSDAMVTKDNALLLFPEYQRPFFGWFFWPDSQAFFFHVVFLILLALFTAGVGGRIVGLACWILHVGFIQRNFSILFGGDVILGIFLLYLLMTQSDARLSLKKTFMGRFASSQQKIREPSLVTCVFYRMIQVQLCVIYVYSGFEKLRGGSWWDGTALWSVFANPQMVIVDLTWTRFVPWFIAMISFSTVLFEVYFVAFVWPKKTRHWILFAGLLFHAGIGLLLGLHAFAVTMLAPYILFLEKDVLERGVFAVTQKLKLGTFKKA